MKENAPLQLKLMDFIKNRLIRETQAQARFYQEIRGRRVYLHCLTLGCVRLNSESSNHAELVETTNTTNFEV